MSNVETSTTPPAGRFFEGTGMLPAMTTWAQNFEDVTLRRALGDVAEGFWIDIGAHDPNTDSVTRWFYDQGWSGVNVEPNPEFLARLKAARPRDVNLGVAVAGAPGRTSLHVIGETGLTTIDPVLATQHARGGLRTTAEIEVEVITLDALCDQHAAGRTIDFLKIDAEGAETDILRTATFSRHRPRIVVVENTGAENYQPLLLSRGYLFVWFDGLNRWYVRDEDLPRADLVARPVSLWDNAHPPGLSATTASRMDPSTASEPACRLEDTARLRTELAALRASTSWRLTAPLRALRRVLGR